MTESLDKRNDIITDLLIDAWDMGRLIAEYEAHYQRGFEAGKAFGAINPEQLKAEFDRGRDSYRDELLARMIPNSAPAEYLDKLAKQPITHGEDRKPIAKSIEVVQPSRSVKISDVGRPEGIPTNFDMCRLVLIDAGRGLTASEIREAVSRRWWPGVPRDWKGVPFGFLGSGKLRKNADNKFEIGSGAATIVNKSGTATLPAVRQAVGPAPAAMVKFDHGDKTAILASSREYALAGRLRKAIGKGHVSEAFLAQNVIGFNSENNRMIVRDLCLGMNPALADVGLKVEHHPGFGLLMKEVE